MQFDQPFHAIVGRFVLMYQDDPVESLRNMAQHLRAGEFGSVSGSLIRAHAAPAQPLLL